MMPTLARSLAATLLAIAALGCLIGGQDADYANEFMQDVAGRLTNRMMPWYNFARQHKTLRCSPAMVVDLSTTLWSMADVVALVNAAAEPAKMRSLYKPRALKQDAIQTETLPLNGSI